MIRKTKTICTLGPTSENENIIKELMLSGMDAVRLNFSHGTFEEHLKKINLVKKVREELNKPIPIILDTKGPEIRLGLFDGKVNLKQGQVFTFINEDILGDKDKGNINFPDLYKYINVGNKVLINDGLVEMEVKDVDGKNIICEVKNNGCIESKKNVHIRGINIEFSLNKKDKEDILFGIQNDIDYIAASFVQSEKNVKEIKDFLNENGAKYTKIISKIENSLGVENLEAIMKLSDGIMVARGDLGLDIPLEEVPRVQKKIIRECLSEGKFVIVATQMLDSMINNPRPTRAEASDVANAIYESTTAVMLSGETANGKYPVESLKTMVNIINSTEQSIDYKKRYKYRRYISKADTVNAIAQSVCTTASELGVKAILSITKSGHTANIVSNFQPEIPIYGVTKNKRVNRQMNLLWGVVPVLNENEYFSTDELFESSINKCVELGLLQSKDVVVLTAGVPLSEMKTTNIMKIDTIN